MTTRQRVKGNSPYEAIVGFSRAVRLGSHVHVSGTVATGADGEIVGKGDADAALAPGSGGPPEESQKGR